MEQPQLAWSSSSGCSFMWMIVSRNVCLMTSVLWLRANSTPTFTSPILPSGSGSLRALREERSAEKCQHPALTDDSQFKHREARCQRRERAQAAPCDNHVLRAALEVSEDIAADHDVLKESECSTDGCRGAVSAGVFASPGGARTAVKAGRARAGSRGARSGKHGAARRFDEDKVYAHG